MKETFIIRTEWYEAFSELSPDDRLIILDNLFLYHRGEENLINLNNLTVKLVWKLIEPTLVKNIESYDNRCKTSARNGALGGRPRKNGKPNENLNKPNLPTGFEEKPNKPDGFNEEPKNHDNDNECDSDSEFDNDLNKNKETSKEKTELVFPFTSELFFEKWNLLVSTDKWKGRANPSLQFNLDTLSKFDEAFAIEMINQAIAGDWNQFKGFELQEYFQKWNKLKNTPQTSQKPAKEKLPFETFWNLYDKKVGKKDKIKKKWDSLSLATQKQILEYIPKYKKAVPEKQYRKNPDRFFNNEGWKDELVETAQQPKGKPVVNIEAIERAKALEEKNKSDRIKAEKLKEYAQKFCMDLLKKENPDMEKDELFPLWDKTWKQEYNQLCDKYGIDKHYKL